MKSGCYRWAYDVSSSMNWVAASLREHDCPDFKTIARLMLQVENALSKLRRAVRNKRYQCRVRGLIK